MTANEERLPRLLALVPYLQARPGIRVAEAAADFGITEAQLRRDLQLLWLCGLPGHGPGDLIDLSFEGETISVIFDAGMSRPLRLTSEEALALVVALRTLAETPGLADSDAVHSALAKVETAAGGAVDDGTVTVALDKTTRLLPVLQRAVSEKRALDLRYHTAARDEISERIVDPLRVFELDGRAYLEAWCRSAEGVRIFRVDRIDNVELLDEASAPPAGIELRDLAEGVYQPAPEHLLAVLRVSEAYAWVADYYPPEEVVELAEGLQVSLRVSEPAWVRSLVLGSGGQVEVLSPGWLADSIRSDAAAAILAYAGK
ncbi:YafY family protein [Jatrophihabitans sp.]|uniref:helix-turn-helix transcriptional regulator n=1 Tax=Jatrophihabitans sp. TaxID=1932789 RepID=UPI0030C743E4|nr:Proteasome accessory factor [Jatrophihabitans sp.]